MYDIFTLQSAAAYLRITPRTLSKMIKDGRIKATRMSKQTIRITSADIEEFLNKSK